MILATTIHVAWMVIGMMIMMTFLMQTLPMKPLSSVMGQLQTRPGEWSDREMAAGSKPRMSVLYRDIARMQYIASFGNIAI